MLAGLATPRRLVRGETLSHAGDAPISCANLQSGVMKIQAITKDGEAAILGLLYPGDFIGRPFSNIELHDIVALTDVTLCSFPKARFEAALSDHPALESLLLRRTLAELDRARGWLLRMGHSSAGARVAGFIEDMARRLGALGCDTPVQLELPLSRGEIAELLGLTIETVSRQFTRLKAMGAIELHGTRGLVVQDAALLRLQAAFDLTRAFDAHLHCLQVTPYAAYALGDGGMSGFPVTSIVEAIEKQRHTDREMVEARLKSEGVSWDWAARDGDSVVRLAEASRLADVVVMSAGPFEHTPKLQVSLTGDVAMQSAAPVLAVAPSVRSLNLSAPVVVAWDGSQEAAIAMRQSLPLLHLAKDVHILTVEEKPNDFRASDAARYLSRHGLEAEVIERGKGGSTIEDVIREEVMRLGAGYLVQGAYGHSRLRQTLFGGVTLNLLSDAPVPLLLGH